MKGEVCVFKAFLLCFCENEIARPIPSNPKIVTPAHPKSSPLPLAPLHHARRHTAARAWCTRKNATPF